MKTNPRRRPATHADVKKAKDQAMLFGLNSAIAIMFSVLVDKHNATIDELQVFWREVNELSDAIDKGYIKLTDLKNTLKQEYGIEV